MAEILGVWIGVMLFIVLFIILFAVVSVMIHVFFEHIKRGNHENNTVRKIGHYLISFVTLSLFILLAIIFAML